MPVSNLNKDSVLQIFEALPYPISPIPAITQDEFMVGDVYYIKKRFFSDSYKEFLKLISL